MLGLPLRGARHRRAASSNQLIVPSAVRKSAGNQSPIALVGTQPRPEAVVRADKLVAR